MRIGFGVICGAASLLIFINEEAALVAGLIGILIIGFLPGTDDR
jgi:hypothetical protein